MHAIKECKDGMNDLISIDWINALNAKIHLYDYGGLSVSINSSFSQIIAIFGPKFCCF